MRFVIANALLFVAYTGVAMMEIWLTFQYKDWDPFNGKSEVIVTGSPWWPLSAVLAACIVNCWLVRLRNPAQRILLGIGLGLLACAVAVVIAIRNGAVVSVISMGGAVADLSSRSRQTSDRLLTAGQTQASSAPAIKGYYTRSRFSSGSPTSDNVRYV